MRILHTVHAYPPEVGGAEAVVERLSRGLVERGHQVEVATAAHPDRGADVDGVPVQGFDTSPSGVWAYRKWVLEGIREERWDVVMTYHSKVFSHLALFPFPDELARRWVYCPTEFTDVASSRPRHLVYYRSLEPMSLRRAARPVVLTKADEKLALELAGDKIEDRLTRIPNGVDVEWWTKGEAEDVRNRHGLPEEAPLVVYAGGLWEHKDVATLVDAVARIGDVHLVVAGSDQGRRAVIEDRIETHGIEQRVHLVGRVSREDLRSLYHTADVFASASRNEGFGLVYLEAMACGLPLVARSVGVIPELAEQGADLVVAEAATAFAQGIETMLTDPAEANPRIVQAYDWEAIVDRFEQLYLDVAEEAG